MATTKERILITLTPSTAQALRARSLREKTPRATIAAQCVELSLLSVPVVKLSLAGETRALRALRAYKREKQSGTLKKLVGGLASLT